MLADKIIFYDDSCPMCKLYTWWFVAWGFLKPENRIAFSNAPDEIMSKMDLDRARHEIPLFDRKTHETIYGLPALTSILGNRWAWLNPIFGSTCFRWVFHPLYQIITYNRRVIAGCRACSGFDCAPDLNRFYRSVYLLIAIAMVGIVSFLVNRVESDWSNFASMLPIILLIHALMTGTIIRIATGSVAAWNHVGNSATVALIVAIVVASTIPMEFLFSVHPGLGWSISFLAALTGIEELRRRNMI